MLTIVNGLDIEYTIGDTFRLAIGSEAGFSAGSKMRFQIAENTEAIISNEFNLNDDGEFVIELSEADKAKLAVNDYQYRITVIDVSGDVVTEKSGNFKVKWGA